MACSSGLTAALGTNPPPPALWASVSPHGEAETAVHRPSELAFSACHTQGSGVCSAKDGAHRTHAAPSTPTPRSPKCSPYTSLCCIGSDGVTGVGLRRRDPGLPAGALSSTEGAESPAATPHSHVAEWGSCWTSRDSPARSACAVTPSLVTLWPRKPRQRRLCVCVWGGCPLKLWARGFLGIWGVVRGRLGFPLIRHMGLGAHLLSV